MMINEEELIEKGLILYSGEVSVTVNRNGDQNCSHDVKRALKELWMKENGTEEHQRAE